MHFRKRKLFRNKPFSKHYFRSASEKLRDNSNLCRSKVQFETALKYPNDRQQSRQKLAAETLCGKSNLRNLRMQIALLIIEGINRRPTRAFVNYTVHFASALIPSVHRCGERLIPSMRRVERVHAVFPPKLPLDSFIPSLASIGFPPYVRFIS